MVDQPLEEFLVLDLSQEVSGAFCGKLFADYGAEVVKVEPPAGDALRRRGPFVNDAPHGETGALHLYLNANKKSITLDLSSPSGARLFGDLTLDADVVIETFPPGYLDGRGLGWPQLSALRPRLCLISITPYGQTGPYAPWGASSLTAFAAGGQMALTGDPDREPLKNAGHQAFYQAGLQAFAGGLAVLLGIALEDNGQHVDISVMECQAAVLEISLPDYAYRRPETPPARRGNTVTPTIGVFPARDGHIGIHAMPRNFPHLARTMGMEWMLEDDRFRDGRNRAAHSDELLAYIMEWAAAQSKQEVYHRAGAQRGPMAFVHTLQDLFESEHLRERAFLQSVDHPVAGRLTYPGPAFQMSDGYAAGRAPLRGEHNTEVYGEWLGLSHREQTRLRATGVV